MTNRLDDDNVRSVLVLGATFNTDNMGVGALASGAVTLIGSAFPKASIGFLDYGREATRSTVVSHGRTIQVPLVNLRFSWKILLPNSIVYLLVVSMLGALLGESFLRRAARRNPWLKSILEADLAVAVSGGDSFSDIYGLGRFFYVYLPQLLVLQLRRPLVMLPQTIGPFETSLARNLAANLMRRAKRVYTRDRAGMDVVRQLLGPHADPARFCFDMGFILEPRPASRAPLAEVERLKEAGRPLVGVNVSGLLFIGGYGRDNAFNLKTDYRRFTEDLIEHLIVRKNASVLLVPHVFGNSEESDTRACQAIYESLKDRYPGRLAWVQGDFDQNEIKHVIGQCDFFVGARMHACIAALSQSVPAVGIAYSLKFLGVFETVGAGDLVADPRRLTGEEMIALIEQAMDRRGTISAELSKTMETVRRELFATMEGVA